MKVSARSSSRSRFTVSRSRLEEGKRTETTPEGKTVTHPRAQRVGKLVFFERKHVVSEPVTLAVARLLQPRAQFVLVVDVPTWNLVLHRGHHLQLCTAPTAPIAQHAQRLDRFPAIRRLLDALAALARERPEKHERAEFLLDAAQHAPALAGDVRDAVRRDAHDGQIVSARHALDLDRPAAPLEDPARVIHGTRPDRAATDPETSSARPPSAAPSRSSLAPAARATLRFVDPPVPSRNAASAPVTVMLSVGPFGCRLDPPPEPLRP